MSRKKLLHVPILFFFLLTGCKDLILLTRGEINYRVPSKKEMLNNYSKNRVLYDSIAELSFMLMDKERNKKGCLYRVIICSDNFNDFEFSHYKKDGCENDPSLSGYNFDAELDTGFTQLRSRIIAKKKSLKNSAACIEIYKDSVVIRYKKYKETQKHVFFKSFVYDRNNELHKEILFDSNFYMYENQRAY